MHTTSPTSANVNIIVAKNTTFSDAFQFGSTADTTWTFSNKSFRMGLKGNFEQDNDTIVFTSDNAQIVVADAALRVIYFNVPHTTLQISLVPGIYLYDFIMIDDTTDVRTQLMHGEFQFAEAVTEG
jgi:hypothetical protein